MSTATNGTTNGEAHKPRRYYLLTFPRTASNLLQKILALDSQPNHSVRPSGGYFFLGMQINAHRMGVRQKNIDDWTMEEHAWMVQAAKDCLKEQHEYLQDAEARGKSVFIKEHAVFLADQVEVSKHVWGKANVKEQPWIMPMPDEDPKEVTRSELNLSLLSDKHLLTYCPTFLIRHPALAFPSMFRAFRDIEGDETVRKTLNNFGITMTLRWTRTMFDFYKTHLTPEMAATPDPGVTWPIVLDGDDVMASPATIVRFAEVVGMDPNKLRYEWEEASSEQLGHMSDPISQRMLSTIGKSTGVKAGLTSKDVVLEVEIAKWKTEFGDEVAEALEKFTRAAMPDYEYMKKFKLQPRDAA